MVSAVQGRQLTASIRSLSALGIRELSQALGQTRECAQVIPLCHWCFAHLGAVFSDPPDGTGSALPLRALPIQCRYVEFGPQKQIKRPSCVRLE